MPRHLVILLLCMVGFPSVAWTQASSTPDKPIRIVVPFSAGGPVDIYARRIGTRLAESAKLAVIVENKPGGNTVIAALEVMRAAPDGHTIMLTTPVTHTQIPHLLRNPPYDPFKDFTPLAAAVNNSMVLQVHKSVPVKNVAELVAYAKANPGKLNYAVPAMGSVPHLLAVALMKSAGIDLTQISYKGAADATNDFLAGRTHLSFDFASTAKRRLDSGKVTSIGVAGSKRVSLFPNLPTIAEQGVASVEGDTWLGFFGPSGMPESVKRRLSSQLIAEARSPEITASVNQDGATVLGFGSDEFTQIVRRDHARWGELIRSAGVSLN